MKKVLVLVVAAFMLSATATFAQKVNVEAFKAKLEKVDADAAHPKKGLKASTWLSRGDAYLEALREPTKVLYMGMDQASLNMLTSQDVKPSESVTMGSREFEVYQYRYFVAYVLNGKVVTWKVKKSKELAPNAADVALESYNKAASLDPSVAAKAKAGAKALVDYYKMQGNLALEMANAVDGAEAYMKVAEIEESPVYGGVEPEVLFYAGYMYTISGDTNVKLYVKGESLLNKAVELGYDAIEDADAEKSDKERGNIYYYLFHCAYGARELGAEKIQAAQEYLETGLSKYPKNEKIFEGLLQLYTSSEGVGDPKDLLSTIEENIKEDPTNVDTWFGRGRIYFALKDYDECIASFEKVTELDPEMFDGFYYLGLFHMLKGDDFLQVMNGSNYTDQASYDVDIKKLAGLYGAAIPIFEKAHELNPTETSTVDYLKQLCFRLREEPGIMDKYNKYNELYKSMH